MSDANKPDDLAGLIKSINERFRTEGVVTPEELTTLADAHVNALRRAFAEYGYTTDEDRGAFLEGVIRHILYNPSTFPWRDHVIGALCDAFGFDMTITPRPDRFGRDVDDVWLTLRHNDPARVHDDIDAVFENIAQSGSRSGTLLSPDELTAFLNGMRRFLFKWGITSKERQERIFALIIRRLFPLAAPLRDQVIAAICVEFGIDVITLDQELDAALADLEAEGLGHGVVAIASNSDGSTVLVRVKVTPRRPH